jgi:putative heme-binding domain-containing protein
VVTADFRMSILDLKDGRVLNGVITARTERALSVMTMTESLTLERAAIDSIQESSLSLMPEGLLEALPPDEARNLIAYLMHSGQVPVPSP